MDIWDSIILDMTVSFSPNLTIILWVHIPWESHVLQKHFNLRKKSNNDELCFKRKLESIWFKSIELWPKSS